MLTLTYSDSASLRAACRACIASEREMLVRVYSQDGMAYSKGAMDKILIMHKLTTH